jgi:hypothetical protein
MLKTSPYNIAIFAIVIITLFAGAYYCKSKKEGYSYSFGFPTWNSVNRRIRFIPRRQHLGYRYNPFLERTPIIDYDILPRTTIPECYVQPYGGCVRGFGRLGNKCCNMDAFS